MQNLILSEVILIQDELKMFLDVKCLNTDDYKWVEIPVDQRIDTA